ncbi:MAG: hypothetical protein ACKOAG_01715, partial [Candidatus Kapaibacterium sp.]
KSRKVFADRSRSFRRTGATPVPLNTEVLRHTKDGHSHQVAGRMVMRAKDAIGETHIVPVGAFARLPTKGRAE